MTKNYPPWNLDTIRKTLGNHIAKAKIMVIVDPENPTIPLEDLEKAGLIEFKTLFIDNEYDAIRKYYEFKPDIIVSVMNTWTGRVVNKFGILPDSPKDILLYSTRDILDERNVQKLKRKIIDLCIKHNLLVPK